MEPVIELTPLPDRPADGHKGTFGTVGVVAGCAGRTRMIGAAVFVATAATRAGAGLVRVMAAEPICNEILVAAPHATALAVPVGTDGDMVTQAGIRALDEVLAVCRCLVIGPGLGGGGVVARLALRAIGQEEVPVVVDADALNALAATVDFAREIRGRVILTPHPGEFRRLAEAVGVKPDPVTADERVEAAGDLARRLGCIVILKGAGTVVSDGHRVWVCQHGHPCMATGGTGDVLAGVLGGLIAQYAPPTFMPGGASEPDLFMLACLGVQAHALAGEAWARQTGASAGLLAGDLCGLIPAAVESLRRGGCD
jgi:hydroxyethylthiazole kinase-like uncharacterized protein yjeF